MAIQQIQNELIADGAVTAAKLASPLGGPVNESQGADVASASTINLTTATGNYVNITGTTAITAITLAQGAFRTVKFAAALTLTNGASLILPGGANITTAAGDTAMFIGEAAGVVRCVQYQAASGKPVASPLSAGSLLNIQYFTTAGTSTYTPTAGTNSVIVEVVGGGGGTGTTAGSGGTSSFGALVSATGGTGTNSTSGAAGGSGSSGDLNLTGGTGGDTNSYFGGGSFYGQVTPSNGTSSRAGLAYGAGASGKSTTNAGAGGGGYARKKITSAFSGVTITVGTGGTGGSGGSNGGQGIVIVYEYA